MGYVIGAYCFAGVVILGYGINLFLRFRRERAAAHSNEEERP